MTTHTSTFDAHVVASFGRHCLVRDSTGVTHEARPAGRRIEVICGDWVLCERDTAHGEIRVRSVQPRRSLLARANSRGISEPIVANLTHLVVVIAPKPRVDLFVLDRYLCAATSAGLRATVVANKADLGPACDPGSLRALVAAGYSALECCVARANGIDALRDALRGESSAFVGQSGVGKSSLVRALLPEAVVTTGTLTRDDDGRHTTTTSRIFALDPHSLLIDSPGVRDFAPAIDRLEPAALGFPEIALHAPQCRFQDCRHLAEPQCAVRDAVAKGVIDARRYESYRRLRRLYTELTQLRGPRGTRRRDA